MPFATAWMDRDHHTELSQTEKDKYDVTHMGNLIFKKDTNELFYKAKTDLQISKTNLWLPKRKHGRKSG